MCLMSAPRFSYGDDFTAKESPNGLTPAPSYAPPDTLSDVPTRSTPGEGIPSLSAPSLLPPSTLERTPYYKDSPPSGFNAGQRPASRSGGNAPSQMVPTDDGLGTNGRDPQQRFEPGTGASHDCSSHGSHRSQAPPSSLPYSSHFRSRTVPAVGTECHDGVCEFGYRGGDMSTRTHCRYHTEAPMSQLRGDGHDHSHGSYDPKTTSPDALQPRCPVDGATLGSRGRPAALLVNGQPVYLCSEQCMMQLIQKSGQDTLDYSTGEFDSFGSPSEEHNHSHSH